MQAMTMTYKLKSDAIQNDEKINVQFYEARGMK